MWQCGECSAWNTATRERCWGCQSKREDARRWLPHKPDNDYEE